MRPIREIRQACLAAKRLVDERECAAALARNPVEFEEQMVRLRAARAALEVLNWVLRIDQHCEVMVGTLNILGDVPGDQT